MKLPVLLAVFVVLVGLRFLRLGALAWAAVWWVAVFITVSYGIEPPLPASIVSLFMGITSLVVLTYAFSDSERLANTVRPAVRFLVEKKFTVPLLLAALILPALVGWRVYAHLAHEVSAPAAGRTIHPAPPSSITFRGRNIDLVTSDNPYRALEASKPDLFKEHVEKGRTVYYQNCVFCHGDDLEGDGIFAHALDPIPANLSDATTIGMLQESYLFWRIAKGGPGLPEESTPWASAMPAWETFLTEDEIWDVILFLYDHSGQKPRAREAEE